MSCVKKLIVSMVVLVVSVFSLCTVAYGRSCTVTGAVLNVRESPDTYSTVLTQVEKGTVLTVVDSSDGWCRISYNGVVGWVCGDYVSISQDSAAENAKNTPSITETNQPGVITGSVVNVRESYSTDSKVITQLWEGAYVTITGSVSGWRRITRNGVTGWVSSDYIAVRETTIGTGIVKEEVVNVRSDPSTDSAVLTTVEKMDRVTVTALSGDWYKVKTEQGLVGYINKSLLTLSEATSSRGVEKLSSDVVKNAEAEPEDSGSLRSRIVAYAKKFLGVSYVYGGSSPRGFDCSGFVQYVYRHFGIEMERVAADQTSSGTKIARSDLKPGDVVFFDTNGGNNYINHVGIYVGNNSFIHASSGHGRVIITQLEGTYAGYYMTARRVVN